MISVPGFMPIPFSRIIGDLSGSQGRTVVFFGGLHGNEPSGVIALQQVTDHLTRNKVSVNGRFIGLAGNLPALRENKRFISKDLNRIWTSDFEQRLEDYISNESKQKSDAGFVSEFQDQKELNLIIAPLLSDNKEALFFDLHTTSSRSAPFIGVKDKPNNCEFAKKFPVATVLGIDDYVDGPLLSYLADRGQVAMVFEAGQHDDPKSTETHVSFIYFALVSAGIISSADVPDFDHQLQRLEGNEASTGILEVVFRHAIKAEDDFKMNPGYRNFVPIRKGEPLAQDRNGPITSKHDGQIFMPLYQSTGEDGFFVVQERT